MKKVRYSSSGRMDLAIVWIGNSYETRWLPNDDGWWLGKRGTTTTATLCPRKKVTDASAVNRHFVLRRNNRLRPVCENGKVSLYVMHERSMHGE